MSNLPANITKKYPTMSTDDLLEEFECWVKLCHYDPHGQSGEYNPFEVAECLRGEVMKRLEPDDNTIEYPSCDTCQMDIDYMPWHYSTPRDRHLHACDTCWPNVDPARN